MLEECGNGVLQSRGSIVELDDNSIAKLLKCLATASKGRARICMHPDPQDELHEMLIALKPNSYVRPHKHLAKSESFHLVQGEVDVIIFNDNGIVERRITLSQPGTGRSFYYRLSEPKFHTVICRAEVALLHEVTKGPFVPGDALLAPWAPDESLPAEVEQYQMTLERTLDQLAKKEPKP